MTIWAGVAESRAADSVSHTREVQTQLFQYNNFYVTPVLKGKQDTGSMQHTITIKEPYPCAADEHDA